MCYHARLSMGISTKATGLEKAVVTVQKGINAL